VAAGCASRPQAAENPAADPAAERYAIARAITETAQAVTDFPQNGKPETVLRFYATDYDGVQDGDHQTLGDVRRILDDLGERIQAGAPIELLARTRNIRVELEGPSAAWATYDLLFAIGAGGRVAFQQDARCTAFYRKTGDAWLVRHEHCSTPRGRK
jgi:ketosteroid isomerase-like protein